MVKISTFDFNIESINNAKNEGVKLSWPVVYIINNDKEAYVGETTNFLSRSKQHLTNEDRAKLYKINLITDNNFNKSSILDLESFLIKYMSADNKYKLQNGNGGLQNHDYYQKDMYQDSFKVIWKELKKLGLVNNDLMVIENSDLFKYSPYKSLTIDQYETIHKILADLSIDIIANKESTYIINGGAGTGKTILGLYLIKLLNDYKNISISIDDETDNIIRSILTENFKIGLVIPMTSLRDTLKKVFKNIPGLNSSMVMSPHEVAKSEDHFDLLIIDESHRLRRRKNLTQYASFDENNKKFNLGNEGTELDWILKKSKYQIMFYDCLQTIKPTDIIRDKFYELLGDRTNNEYYLTSQLRCRSGNQDYVGYLNNLFNNNLSEKIEFTTYEFKLYNDVDKMINDIKEKDKEYKLCRNIAGYSWNWVTNKHKFSKNITESEIKTCIANGIYDIEIENNRYIWNTTSTDWINSKNAINEVGCIHTVQGYDLNYTGLIIGNELRYDTENKRLYIDKTNYHDANGKKTASDEELLEYITNIYITMATRGIRGTYIYACDKGLRDYLSQYMHVVNKY